MIHENSLEKIKNTLRVFAKQHNVPCISSATETYLLQHLMKYKPQFCLEIGSAIGYSTIHIAHTIQKWNGKLVSFEISHPSYRGACYQLNQGHYFNTKIYHTNFLDISLETLFKKNSLDFIFIDGAKKEYAKYLKKIIPYCTSNATIICDDVIKFQKKVSPIYDIIKQYHLHANIVQLEADDGILNITISHHKETK